MRQSQYQESVLGELRSIHTHAVVAEHRLTGLRHHLRQVAAEPPLLDGLWALPSAFVLVGLTTTLLLFS